MNDHNVLVHISMYGRWGGSKISVHRFGGGGGKSVVRDYWGGGHVFSVSDFRNSTGPPCRK